jgi:hypothetical protein
MTSTPSRERADAHASARRAVFVAWLFAFLLSYFFRSANAVIAGELRLEFDLDAERLGLMTSAFFGTLALAQLPLGVALDRWGPRRVVPAMMLAGAVGALTFASATTFATLTLGRALLGLGFAGVLVGALQAFGGWFPERRFATVSGLLVGLGTGGALVAGTPLAWLAETVGWRAVFAGGSALIVAAAAAIALGTREATRAVDGPSHGADAPGGAGSPRAAGSARRGRLARHRAAQRGLLAHRPPQPVRRRHAAGGAGPVGGSLPGRRARAADRRRREPHRGDGARHHDRQLRQRRPRRPLRPRPRGHGGRRRLRDLPPAPRRRGPGVPIVALGALYLAFGSMGAFGVVLFAHVRAIFPRHLGGRAITGINLVGIAGAMGVQWLMGAIIEGGRGADGAYGVTPTARVRLPRPSGVRGSPRRRHRTEGTPRAVGSYAWAAATPWRASRWRTESHAALAEAVADISLDPEKPNHLHGRRRGQAGKPFLVEKPLARTVAEADEVIAAAEAAGVVGVYGENMRFSPALAQGHARRRAATDRITTDRRPRRPCRTLAAIPRTSGSASRSAS